jgi:hypothetical protein
VPPNIAPLNFAVAEPGERCFVRLSGSGGRALRVAAAGRSVRIPQAGWRALLAANRGREIRLDVYTRAAGGGWQHFQPLRLHVAPEAIDDHLVYRLLDPAFNIGGEMGIYQRDLTCFKESALLTSGEYRGGCINCHTFRNNKPDTFLIHLRPTGGEPSMLIAREGKAARVDTRTEKVKRAASYPAWHPSGKVIAFSWNHVCQFFHTAGAEPRDVLDLDSGIALYWVARNAVSSAAAIDDPNRLESFPAWSPDGNTLYFCTAPIPWAERKPIPYRYVPSVRYDLVRARFNLATGEWSAPETLVSAKGPSLQAVQCAR